MKNLKLFLIGMIIIFVQAFCLNYFSSFVTVNLLLIYIVFISLYIDKNSALFLSGSLGLMSGMILGGIIGLDAILFLILSYFLLVIEKSIFKDNKYIISLLVFGSSFVYVVINAVISSLVFSPPLLIIVIIKVILISLINTVFAYIGYSIFEDNLKRLR